jgi:hypothetical protein
VDRELTSAVDIRRVYRAAVERLAKRERAAEMIGASKIRLPSRSRGVEDRERHSSSLLRARLEVLRSTPEGEGGSR